jgi:general secretion pathway protein K
MVNRFLNLLHRCKNERGMALLATMLAIALMTIIVVDFTSSSAMGYLSAANHANEIRATYLARSGINVGLALIAQDSRAQMAQAGSSGVSARAQVFDSFASVWAIPFPPMPVNGGTIQLAVVDEARKFDINKLIIPPRPGSQPAPGSTAQPGQTSQPAQNSPIGQTGSIGQASSTAANQPGQIDPIAVAQLARLIAILGLSPDIVPAIVDWLDQDSIDSPGGAEADYYLGLIPPYEPRNGAMPTLGDLHLVRGIDDVTFMKLRNFLTVAPTPLVNANTASPEVLACLEPEMTEDPRIVQAILKAREIRPFTNLTDVYNVPEVGALQSKLKKDLTTRCDYFTISGLGTFAGARKMAFAAFLRNGDGTATLGSWQED